MSEIEPELRAALRSAAEAMRGGTRFDRVVRTRVGRYRRRRRTRTVAMSLVILAVFGVVVWRVGSGVTRSVSTPPAGPSRPGQWQRIAGPATGFAPGSSVRAVAPLGRGFAALGTATPAKSAGSCVAAIPTAAAWSSPNGRTWQRVTGRAGSPNALPANVQSFISTPHAVLAFARPVIDVPTQVWSTSDGRHWQLLTVHGPTGTLQPDGVAGGFGYVAVTQTVPTGPVPPNGPQFQSVLWWSPDAKHWQPDTGGPRPGEVITGITTSAHQIVAVGGQLLESRPVVAGRPPMVLTVWTSRDGRRWSRIDHPVGLTAAATGPIASNGGGLLVAGLSAPGPTPTTGVLNINPGARPGCPAPATGPAPCTDPGGYTALWSSADGRSWQQTTPPPGPFPSGITSLTATHHTWLASGLTGGCSSPTGVIYQSSDARTWSPAVSDPGSFTASYLLAPSPQGAIVIIGGGSNSSDIPSPDVLIWTPPTR